MGCVGAYGKMAAKALEQWYKSQDDAHRLIFKHACIGGGIALIPLPLVGEVAVIINQIAMYKGINDLVGIKFSDSVLRNIVKFTISQLAGIGAGMAVLLGVSAVGKWIPGFNFLAGFMAAPVAGVANYACGIVYYNMLGNYLKSGGDGSGSDAEIIAAIKQHSLSDAELRRIKEDAERRMKNADYKKYTAEAEACANAARR